MQTIIVGTPGPQGSKGDQGIQGPSGSLQASNSGSFSITGSLTVSGSSTLTNIGPAVFSGSLDVTQGITGSLFGTASYADYALSASHEIVKEVSSSHADFADAALSSSYALTASYLDNYIPPFPYTGSALITGSLGVTGSLSTIFTTGDGLLFNKDGAGNYIKPQTFPLVLYSPNSSIYQYINNSGIGINTPPSARLHVKGSGTTSSTTSLLIQNSNESQLFKISDDGNIQLGISQFLGTLLLGGDSNIRSTANRLSLQAPNGVKISSTNSWAVSSAQLEITSTTKGLLPPRTNLTSNISNPAQGLITYLTGSTNEGLYYYNSGSYQGWTRILNDSGSQNISGDVTVTGSLTVHTEGNSTQATSVIYAGTGSLALVPSGSGAIVASVPDGTAVGGNARGEYAVDLQRVRTDANQVASSNHSVILGGLRNRITSTSIGHVIVGGIENVIQSNQYPYNAILGGQGNEIIGSQPRWSTLGGGQNNLISGQYGSILGGTSNNNSSNYGTISGGQSNTASTNTHATVVGGQDNTSSGQHSVSGGRSNTASGQRAIALGGYSTASGGFSLAIGDANSASGGKSVVLGADSSATQTGSVAIGNVVFSQAEYAFVTGNRTRGYLYGQSASANGRFSGNGDAQVSKLIARKSDTLNTGAATILSLDGSGTSNLIIPYSIGDRAWNVKVETIAVVTSITGTADGVSVGDALMQDDSILFARVGGTSSIVGTNNTNLIASTSMGDASMTYSAGSSEELEITFNAPTFTGGGSVTCRVVSKVSLVEVAW